MRGRRLAAALTAALLAAGTVSGCAASRALAPLGAADLTTVTTAGTHDAGTITWNLPYEPFTLDPLKSFNYAENTAIANMCESLLRLKPDLTTEGALAQKVDSPNPLTWVYRLRGDVTFWDGTAMTARDVVASLRRNLDPAAGTYWGQYFENVRSIDASGPLEVTVRLKQPDVLFNKAMATAAGAVMKADFIARAGSRLGNPQTGVMCTGPFKLATWRSGDHMLLVRNDHYWDPALRPVSGALDFRFIADETTAVNALRSGEIDGQYFYLPPANISLLRLADQGRLTAGKSLVGFTLIGAAATGPFADPRIRQALLSATDRQAVSRVIFQDTALPARALASEEYWGYERTTFADAYAHLPDTRVDLAKAKALVAASGQAGKPITIAIQGSSAVHAMAGSILQATGRTLGLDIRIRTVPVEQYGNLYVDPQARKGIDAFFSTWYGNVADPLDALSTFTLGNRNNYNDYATVDAALRAARAEQDPARRAKLVVDIQRHVTEDAPWLPLEQLPVLLYQSKRITGATASFAYLYYPWAAKLGTP
ncbi:ABC transporter substrate-binding protein [Specibacter cremeus]|uniref:ABC transporter substrate-binding protein n=1 Tax=Specibacter cremeus TaxID=1629051 RepID=UPI000F798A40|nr:ABC transporter substrate-binding protein [Specibacter cremeus]